MIRGSFSGQTGRLRPVVHAQVTLPSLNLAGKVTLLVDTGADHSVLAPSSADDLGVPVTQLPPGTPSIGVGGRVQTAMVDAVVTLDTLSFPVVLRVLVPSDERQQRALRAIPSLLGRDILAHFALFMEERTQRVFLLEPHEAAALPLS